jgi:ribosomal protein L20
MNRISLTDAQLKQIIWAIDLAENTLEDLTDSDLQKMNIEIDRKMLFEIADYLDALSGSKVGA